MEKQEKYYISEDVVLFSSEDMCKRCQEYINIIPRDSALGMFNTYYCDYHSAELIEQVRKANLGVSNG